MSETPPLTHVTWWELPVLDLATVQDFYGAVFGWTFTPFGEGYVAVNSGETMIGGLTETPGPLGSGIRVYVNVADIETTLAKVAAAAVRSARRGSRSAAVWAGGRS